MMNQTSRTERIVIGVVMGIVCALCVLPIIAIISISISDGKQLIMDGYSLLPRGFSLEGYKYIFRDMGSILRAYYVSIVTTAVGTALGLVLNSMFAYVLSRRTYRYRKFLVLFLTIPMVLNSGLVPFYIWVTKYLKMKDTWAVLILPTVVVPWYIIMLRTFFTQIPYDLSESAIIDGAGEFRIFWQIIVPLAKPALATVGMFLALHYWNSWYHPMLFIEDKSLINLQYKLYKMMADIMETMRSIAQSGLSISLADMPTDSMRMAMCLIAAGPMLVVFPFFQKYFVKGLTVGGVKG